MHVVQSKQFRKDLRRLRRAGTYDLAELDRVVQMLADGLMLPPEYRNHPLRGKFEGREECHIRGDWLLVYRRNKEQLTLLLLRTGTHQQLFGR